jgi:folate-dependent phosphoribosylglycinamide formyltransferase PurN
VLAGYLRLVPAEVTRRYAGHMLNVHPGPLPAFGGAGMHGAHVHRAVLAAGAPLSGPTVHFVDEIYDHGRQLVHWPVPVRPDDDDGALAARVLRAEHLLFPRVVQAVARRYAEGRSVADRDCAAPRVLPPFDPGLDDASLARQLDDWLSTM